MCNFCIGCGMGTKLGRLKELWASGDLHGALRIAARFPMLGTHRDAILQGWAARMNPDFYRQLGEDPEAIANRGLEAVAARYGLETRQFPSSG